MAVVPWGAGVCGVAAVRGQEHRVVVQRAGRHRPRERPPARARLLDMLLDQLAVKADRMAQEARDRTPIRSPCSTNCANATASSRPPCSRPAARSSPPPTPSCRPDARAAHRRPAAPGPPDRGYRATEGHAADGLLLRVIVPIPVPPPQPNPSCCRSPRTCPRPSRCTPPASKPCTGLPGAVPRPQRPQAHLHPSPDPHPCCWPVRRGGRRLRAHPPLAAPLFILAEAPRPSPPATSARARPCPPATNWAC